MRTLERDSLVEHGIAAAVQAGLFRNEEEAMQEAISTWFAMKPNLRLEVVIELFKEGKITMNRAAEMVGLNRWQFQNILAQRGVKIEVEADSTEELVAAAAAIRRRMQ